MREIKFRAWDKENRVMVYSDDNANDDYAFIIEKNGLEFYYIDTDRHLMDTNSIKMQYTGLKDKNGKEIYEGDILYRKGFWSHFVGFENGCFVTIPLNKVQRMNWRRVPVNDRDLDYWEIRGNIYEDRHLLEGAANER